MRNKSRSSAGRTSVGESIPASGSSAPHSLLIHMESFSGHEQKNLALRSMSCLTYVAALGRGREGRELADTMAHSNTGALSPPFMN